MRRAWFLLLCLTLPALGLVTGCGPDQDELTAAYQQGYEDGFQAGAAVAPQTSDECSDCYSLGYSEGYEQGCADGQGAS